MKIASVLSRLGFLALLGAAGCGRSAESAPPAESPKSPNALQTQEGEPSPPPAAAMAPAPQGLDQPKSVESGRDEELSTLAGAERALNQAREDLDRSVAVPPGPARERSADAAEKKDAPRATAGAGAPAASASAPGNRCENACRAFASLTRAAGAVCRLDGDSGTHCNHAKRVVSDSERRVASCTCPNSGP